MAENKKSFILYVDQQSTIEALSDEQAGKLIKHIYKYVNDENPIIDDQLLNIAFMPIKQQLKRDLKRWELRQLQRSEAGRRSAEIRSSKANEAERNPTVVDERVRTSTVNGTVNGTVNVNGTVIKKKRKKDFVPPLLEEVKKYFDDNGYTEDSAIRAFNYYSSSEWIDSKGNSVLNWKGKMITVWFKPEHKKTSSKKLMMP